MNIMRRVKADYDKALSEVDVLVMPTVPFVARRHVESGAGPLACVEKCGKTSFLSFLFLTFDLHILV